MVTISDFLSNSSSSAILIGGSATGTAGDDILIGSSEDDSLTGEAGNDILLGMGGNNILSGGTDNDTITGGGVSLVSNGSSPPTLVVTADTNGRDTLTGGAGNDRFVLGGRSNSDLASTDPPIVMYNDLGDSDYALITDFNSTEDVIELGGAKASYRLEAAPGNLPTGTALYLGNELIAIIQGSSNLGLNADYFRGSVS